MAQVPPPAMKMTRRYRAEAAGSQQPRTMKPAWPSPVCRVCLAKPETNSCAGPRKAGQQENPQADPTDIRMSVSSDGLLGSSFVRPNEARHIQTAFPAFAKRPGTPTPPEKVVLPGLLVQPTGAPEPPKKILSRGGAHFHEKWPWRWAFAAPGNENGPDIYCRLPSADCPLFSR